MSAPDIGGGIKFGAYWFSEPEPVPSKAFSIFDQAGLYVVLAYDASWGPRPFRPLYFGESGGIGDRCTSGHEKCSAWRAQVGLLGTVYRALLHMPGSTRVSRQAAESTLIASYNTPCNDRL
jgi:hypothetical protein